jgi:integrase
MNILNLDTMTPAKAMKARKCNMKPLTEIFIKGLKPTGERRTWSDSTCQGLKLRIGASGSKTFAFMGRDCHGENRTIKLGSYPDVGLKEARKSADEHRRTLGNPDKLRDFLEQKPEAEEITLLAFLVEVEAQFGQKQQKKIWLPRGKRSEESTARQVISKVFGALLEKQLSQLSIDAFVSCTSGYKPVSGKSSANGQVSKALAYLRPSFDWAAHRGNKFQKLGAGRATRLELPDLAKIHDPATDDPLLEGERDRVLLPWELEKIIQELKVGNLDKNDHFAVDLRPVAHLFILLTLSRRSEVENARWEDIDLDLLTWTKSVKSLKGPRKVTHPISDAAADVLRSLPGYANRKDDDFVFPNRSGGTLDNWPRSTEVIQKASGTSGWTRHDLRRSSATILEKMGVAMPLIDTLLSHQNAFASQNTSSAASAYIKIGKQMKGLPDPLRDAVNLLANVLQRIKDGEFR